MESHTRGKNYDGVTIDTRGKRGRTENTGLDFPKILVCVCVCFVRVKDDNKGPLFK